jgi:LysR family transcriptional regulator, hca operon transcriptional activator
MIDDYIRQTGLAIAPAHEADNIAMAISLVASRRGFALLPRYAQNFLPRSVVSRPIKGKTPAIDLVVGYHKANTSPILKLFLSKTCELIRRVEQGKK